MVSMTKDRHCGFTLVEFMIASALMMVMLGATFTLMNNLFTANTTMQLILNTQQNLRVAMNTISRDVTMAGTGLTDSGVPVPNGTNSAKLARPGLGVVCGVTTVGCIPTPGDVLAILSPGDGAGPNSTDALTIATDDQTSSTTWVTTSITTDGTVVNFTPEIRSGSGLMSVKDLFLFNNANGTVFGCVTKVSTTQSQAEFKAGDALNINQPTAQFGNIGKGLDNGDNPATFPPTTAVRVLLITYYIDNSSTQNPKLMRAVNGNTPQVMVEGIENLQFSYDTFDYTNNTETSNVSSPTTPNQIRSVRVVLVGHSTGKLRGTGDYYHFTLASKINVRNATFRNRYSS